MNSIFEFLLDLVLEWDDIPSYEYLVPLSVPESSVSDVDSVRWVPTDLQYESPGYPSLSQLRLEGILPESEWYQNLEFMLPGEGIREAMSREQYGHFVIYGGHEVVVE